MICLPIFLSDSNILSVSSNSLLLKSEFVLQNNFKSLKWIDHSRSNENKFAGVKVRSVNIFAHTAKTNIANIGNSISK